jgi:hypothetical protein
LHFWGTRITDAAGVVFDNGGFNAGCNHYFFLYGQLTLLDGVPVDELASDAGTAPDVRLAVCKAFKL